MTMMNRSLHQQVQDLSVVCLSTANFDLTLRDVCQGKRTVIDFWTVQCTRCPVALDKINALASSMASSGDTTSTVVQFITVCCGKELDAAREILDGPRGDDGRRWNHLAHYFMDYDTKEAAKQLLGFRQVPFYVVVDEWGKIVYADGAFDAAAFLPAPATTTTNNNKIAATCYSPTNVLVIDDLDF